MNYDPHAPATAKKSTGMATASLVCGIVAYATCILGVFTAIPAIICGAVSLSRISKSPGAFSGSGRSIAGIILGGLWFVTMPAVFLLMAIAVPNFTTARRGSQTNTCKANMKQIYGATELARMAGSNVVVVSDLVALGMLKSEPVCPVDATPYKMESNAAPTRCHNYALGTHEAEL